MRPGLESQLGARRGPAKHLLEDLIGTRLFGMAGELIAEGPRQRGWVPA